MCVLKLTRSGSHVGIVACLSKRNAHKTLLVRTCSGQGRTMQCSETGDLSNLLGWLELRTEVSQDHAEVSCRHPGPDARAHEPHLLEPITQGQIDLLPCADPPGISVPQRVGGQGSHDAALKSATGAHEGRSDVAHATAHLTARTYNSYRALNGNIDM